jgi:uncharacterized protein with beta-barrel porin domain
MTSRLQNRRDTAANWTSNNPTLAAGEIGLEVDTSKFKMGDGTTAWNSLEYITSQNETQAFGNNYEGLVSIENLTTIDTVVASEWRTLKYVISMTKTSGGANKFAATELTVLIDGSNVTVSEYGVIDNDGEVGTVSVSQSGGNVNVIVTPNLLVRPITVRYYRTGLKA